MTAQKKNSSRAAFQADDNFEDTNNKKIHSVFPLINKISSSTRQLFLASFIALYIELMLIRWMSTEVHIFAFFQNLALIATFLGFAVGFYLSQKWRGPFMTLNVITILVILVKSPLQLGKFISTSLLGLSSDAVLWGYFSGQLGSLPFSPAMITAVGFTISIILTAVLILLLILAMIPLGQWVGQYLDTSRDAVKAYTVNLIGSLAGIWLISGLSFLGTPPVVWFGLAYVVVIVSYKQPLQKTLKGLIFLGLTSASLFHSTQKYDETHWSPYQKVQVKSLGNQEYNVLVNNWGYMTMAKSPLPDSDSQERLQMMNAYDSPFQFTPQRDQVLILGAGAGNDVAAALRNGAGHVDAVEIDPVIYSLGKRLHPEDPYDSPSVRVIVTDAREFMSRSQEKYDVILFGLLDSHTQFSDFSHLRIDNYVYTKEALQQARDLLKPSGVLIVKFEVREPWLWIGERISLMLEHEFDSPPRVFFAPPVDRMAPATVFLALNDPSIWTENMESKLNERLLLYNSQFQQLGESPPPPTTDDWPYMYNQRRSIPRPYLTVSVVLLLISLFLVRRVVIFEKSAPMAFFFLGAGFMVLETQLISRLALYMGSTWLVNGIAISFILMTLVAANIYVFRRQPKRLEPFYVLLVISLLFSYAVPWNQLSLPARTVGYFLSLAYAISIFFAGVIFTTSFTKVSEKSKAFGINLIGAVAGGLAQNISFIVGVKALLIIAILFYAAGAFVTHRRSWEVKR